jgi:hypothetical protein
MEEIDCGFNLVQPWAQKVVDGELPFLVRSVNTKKRGRVAVISTSKFDAVVAAKMTYKALERLESEFAFTSVLGTVLIADVREVALDGVLEELGRLGGEEYMHQYPQHFIPSGPKTRKLFIWFLEDPMKVTPRRLRRRLIQNWTRLDKGVSMSEQNLSTKDTV